MKLVSQKPVTLLEVNEMMQKRQKETSGEIPYEQQNTLAYSALFAERITPAKAKELKKELNALGYLSAEQVVSLMDILPKKDDVTKAILTGEKLEVTEDQVKEVTKLVKKYQKETK